MNQAIIIAMTVVDITTLITIAAAYKAPKVWYTLVAAIAASISAEIINSMVRTDYQFLQFFPQRCIGQLLLGVLLFWLFHRKAPVKKSQFS